MANATDNTKAAIDTAADTAKASTAKAADAVKANADKGADMARDNIETAREGFKAQADFGRQAYQQTADAFRKSVDSSVATFGELNAQTKRNLEAFADSAAIATETAQQLGAQAAAYGRQALEGQVAVTKQLAGAKTFQEAWDIQSTYAKSAMDRYLGEANRWTEAMTTSTVRAWQPINDRVAAVVSQVNAR